MKTLNKVFLVGSVGRDPEIRSTGGGTLIATISMATNESYKDSSGEWATSTTWHNLKAFARTAEIIRDYVVKGSPLHIEGKLNTEQWEKDGVKHYKTVIVIENLIMLGSGDGKSKQASGQTQSSRRDAPKGNTGQSRRSEPQEEFDESSIPF
jgi:single-strand DNA-binding protein